VPSLTALIKQGKEIVGVVTQPDRPKGRGQKLTSSPVKETALAYNLAIYQPEKINTPEFQGILRGLAPDLIIVAAFGQLLGREILELPVYGCINVHASLLPKYRGAAPIHRAIINGEQETGITTMYMEVELDAGDMLLQEKVAIQAENNLAIVHDKLADLGGEVLLKTLEALEKGRLLRTSQDHSQATYAEKIEKKEVEIDWSQKAEEIYNLVRGTNPWPGAYTFAQEKLWKIWRVEIAAEEGIYGLAGEIIDTLGGKGMLVAAGQGKLILREIQPENNKRMQVEEYLKGKKIEIGFSLGRMRE